jgi:hypothetical protein
LIFQLSSLERRTARSGKDSIDHAPGQHDDLANAVAGAAWASAARGGPLQVSDRTLALASIPDLHGRRHYGGTKAFFGGANQT